MTQLGDDPAAEWLSSRQSWEIAVLGWLAFGVLSSFLMMVRVLLVLVLNQTLHYWGHLPDIVSGAIGAAMFNPARRAVIRLKSWRGAIVVRRNVARVRAIDDWSALDGEPDGSLVSVVGWIRGRLELEYPVNGQGCIGLALPCEEKFPGVLESLHDFELLDESGSALVIRVADGRMLGSPNVRLKGNHDTRLLLASLDLPAGVVPADMSAFALRDGDPVMIVGYKQTFKDPDGYGALRAALGSSSPRPLLIFPLAAERRVAQADPVAANG